MSKKTCGLIGLVMLTAAFLVGLFGILQYSVTAAGIYLVGSIAVFLIFVYAFCAKCPVRDNCTHVLQGMVTHLMPGRTTGAYSRCDLLGLLLFFGFVALFPQVLADPKFDANAGILDIVFGKLGNHSLRMLQGMRKHLLSAAV